MELKIFPFCMVNCQASIYDHPKAQEDGIDSCSSRWTIEALREIIEQGPNPGTNYSYA